MMMTMIADIIDLTQNNELHSNESQHKKTHQHDWKTNKDQKTTNDENRDIGCNISILNASMLNA